MGVGDWLNETFQDKPTKFVFGEKPKEVKQTKEQKQQGTDEYYTEGLEKPATPEDQTGMYQQALPGKTPQLQGQAAEGKFAAQASTIQAPTPDSVKKWTDQVQAADTGKVWQGVNMTPGLQYNTQVQQGQAAGMAPELLNQLMAASRGQGPSAAQAQLQTGMDEAIAAQQAQIAASRGAINPAVLRQQQQQLATATQQQAGQAAALSAQEQQQAMQTAAQAVAQQRGIESQENTTSMQVQSAIQQGNFQAAQDLVKTKVQQDFAAETQQKDFINQALAQGQISADEAARQNAQLETQVNVRNADTIFKAAQGDQSALLESEQLKAQVIDNWVKSGMAYDQARVEADNAWNAMMMQGRIAASDAASRNYATAVGAAQQNAPKGALSSILAIWGAVKGGVGGGGGAPPTTETGKYKGGVVQGYACGGVAKPRVNMAQGGMVEPVQAVASGGLAVHPAILEQQQMQQPAATPMTGAPVPGDSPANDTVPAQLSPGEVVIPRSAVASGRSGILSFIDALDREGKLGDARQLASTPSYGEVLQAKQKIKKA